MKIVNKKQWSRFCRDVCLALQFAIIEVLRVNPGRVETLVCNRVPLLGVALARKRGKISAFEVRPGQNRNGLTVALPLLLGVPGKIFYKTSGENAARSLRSKTKMVVR